MSTMPVEAPAATPVRRRPLRRFKVDIVAVFCALVIPTVLIISAMTYTQMVEATRDITSSLAIKASDALIDKTTNYLKPAQVLAEIAPSMVRRANSPPLRDDDELEKLFADVLRGQAQIDYFYYGNEQGEFLQAIRDREQQEVSTKYLRQTEGFAEARYRFYDSERKAVRETWRDDETYDPRERPWYRDVKSMDTTIWTDLYVFHSINKLGITAAVPVYDDQRQLVGVVAADITLDGLSQFLQEQQISANGIAFILDRKQQLVAYPDIDRMIADDARSLRPLLAQELDERWITDAVRNYQDHGLSSFRYQSDGDYYLATFTPFPAAFGKEWTTVVLLPERDFLGKIEQTSIRILLVSAVVLTITILLGLYFARNLSRPIESLTEEVEDIRRFNFHASPPINSHIKEIQTMFDAFVAMKHALMAFRLFVPAELVRRLIESGEEVEPGGKEREVTLFFSDIEGFTEIAEQVPARELMVDLSAYFEEVTQPIFQQKGTVDKFIGDAVMAFWGAPEEDEDQAFHACNAALDCQRRIKALNHTRQQAGKAPLKTRIGVHTGFSVVGNVGTSERLNYTALGDNVNLASRLEKLNKRYRTEVIISQGTLRYIRNHFIWRPLDFISVTGKESGVLIYELMGKLDDADAPSLSRRAADFKQAHEYYLKRRWNEALEILNRLQQQNPDDWPVTLYQNRCLDLLNDDPGPGWHGYHHMHNHAEILLP